MTLETVTHFVITCDHYACTAECGGHTSRPAAIREAKRLKWKIVIIADRPSSWDGTRFFCPTHRPNFRCRPGRCRLCGCTDHNCEVCVIKTGQPCHWVEADLCSACV